VEPHILYHTADLLITLEAESLEELFIDAARALSALLSPSGSDVPSACEYEIAFEGGSAEQALVNWLNELLFLFDAKSFLACDYEVISFEPGDGGVRARVRLLGINVSEAGIEKSLEIKAATYHGLEIRSAEGKYRASVLFDV
jgi:SHS2 domain-containing protein